MKSTPRTFPGGNMQENGRGKGGGGGAARQTGRDSLAFPLSMAALGEYLQVIPTAATNVQLCLPPRPGTQASPHSPSSLFTYSYSRLANFSYFSSSFLLLCHTELLLEVSYQVTFTLCKGCCNCSSYSVN